MNRTVCPEISRVSGVEFPVASVYKLKNGATIHELPFGDEEIVRVDCLFKAGTTFQSQLLVASFSGQLLREGTRSHTSSEIAEKLDSYGAALGINVSYETSNVSMYALNRHLEPMLRLLAEIVTEPAYPQKEFESYLNKRKQQYLISNEKVSSVASRNLNAALFGPKSVYGSAAVLEDFDSLHVDLFKAFHRDHYTMGDCDIIVSGNVDDNVRKMISEIFGSIESGTRSRPSHTIYVSDELNKKYCFQEKADSVQSAIYMGRKIMSAKEPDYHSFSVLNTVLGGYFGSRLMSNIREEKGYTYGIGSYIWVLPTTGSFLISTQTATSFVEPTLTEIEKELASLRETSIPDAELDAVRSYMLGENARVMDGSFSFVDAYISFLTQGIDGRDFYHKSEEAILSVTSEELRAMAQKYFDREQFCVSVAGQKTR